MIQFNYDVQVKWSHYRPGVAQRVGRSIALLFHDRGTRRWWVLSSTPRLHFSPGKDPVPILQEAGWVNYNVQDTNTLRTPTMDELVGEILIYLSHLMQLSAWED